MLGFLIGCSFSPTFQPVGSGNSQYIINQRICIIDMRQLPKEREEDLAECQREYIFNLLDELVID